MSEQVMAENEQNFMDTSLQILMLGHPSAVFNAVRSHLQGIIGTMKADKQKRTVSLMGVGVSDLRIRDIIAEQIDTATLITNYWWSWGAVTAGTTLTLFDKTVPEDYAYILYGLERLQAENLISCVEVDIGTREEVHDVTSNLSRDPAVFYWPEPFSAIEGESMKLNVEPHTTGTLIMKVLGIEVLTGAAMKLPAI